MLLLRSLLYPIDYQINDTKLSSIPLKVLLIRAGLNYLGYFLKILDFICVRSENIFLQKKKAFGII